MKTLKFALIAAIVACTMVSLSRADGFHEKPISKKIMNISLEKAMKIPGLVAAMYQQIDKREILHSPNHIYVARVVYQGTEYHISGTLGQWFKFFKWEGISPVNTKKGFSTN